MPQKYVSLIGAIYALTINQIRGHLKLVECFETKSGVRQGFPISPFVFNLVMDGILNTAVDGLNDIEVELAPGSRLCDLEYADDVVCFLESTEDAQMVLDRLGNAVRLFQMRFAPAKWKISLQDCISPVPFLMLDGEPREEVRSFTYLGSIVTGDSSIGSEMNDV